MQNLCLRGHPPPIIFARIVRPSYNTVTNSFHIKKLCSRLHSSEVQFYTNKMLSYRRETALQGTLVLAESGRLELGDNILLIPL